MCYGTVYGKQATEKHHRGRLQPQRSAVNSGVPAHDQQMVLTKEEAPEEWRPGMDQLDPEPLNIKEEDQEPWTRYQHTVKEESNVMHSSLIAVPLKNEDYEEKPLFSHLHQHRVEDRDYPTSSSADHMEVASDAEDCKGAETTRNSELNTRIDDSSSSETEFSEDYEGDEDVNYPDSQLKDLSDFGLKTKDSNKVWEDIRAPESDVHTFIKSLKCSECGKHYANNRSLQRHMTCHPGVRSSSHSVKKRSVGVKKNVKSHRKVQTKSKAFRCHDCDKQFTSKNDLNRHLRVHSGDKPFFCNLCEKGFSQVSHLNTHMRIHTGDKPFPCDVCGQRFTHKSTLISHLKLHTGDKPFSCDVCGQRFRQTSNLNSHMRTHTRDKSFTCDVCGQRFTHKSTLNSHLKIHTGDKPFSCDVCAQQFGRSDSLNSHMRVHTGDKPFRCDICGQRFSRSSNLNSHTRVHTGEKPFPCDFCRQRFSHKSTLKAHMRVHTGDKPFSCDICGQRFRQRSSLNSHLISHRDKPFPCHVCRQRFSHMSKLYAHMRFHTDDKPFPCHVCGQSFSRKDNLNRHLRIHTDEKTSSKNSPVVTQN